MSLITTNNKQLLQLELEYKTLKNTRDELKITFSTLIEEILSINPNFFGQELARAGSNQEEANSNSEAYKSKLAEVRRLNKEKYSELEPTAKIKEMWRKIAASCHPDKTTDTRKNNIYKLAGDAKTNMDEDAMTHLFVQMSEGSTDLPHHNLVCELILSMTKEINHFKSSKLFQLYELKMKNRILFLYTINPEKP